MKYFIANWKMNGSRATLEDYCAKLLANTPESSQAHTILALPAILIPTAQKILKSSKIQLAAQCISDQAEGAYTGQISAQMYAESGCTYALVGHSERRKIESIQSTCQQVTQCLSANIKPIICIGETLQEKNDAQTSSVLYNQLSPIIDIINDKNDVWIAYEPRWAIGSGLTPDNNEINIISEWVKEKIDTKFIYGGSVTPDNIQNLTSCYVDGFLVGGASLNYKLTNQMVDVCTHYS